MSLLGFCALFSYSANAAECINWNGTEISGPVPPDKHCSRGFAVPKGQDFCLNGNLTKTVRVIDGMVSMTGSGPYGKVYDPKSLKCIPGGLLLNRDRDWCPTNPKHVIRVGQPCPGGIIAAQEPSP